MFTVVKPRPSSFCGVNFIQKFEWVLPERERQTREGGKIKPLIKRQYLENARRHAQSYYQ